MHNGGGGGAQTAGTNGTSNGLGHGGDGMCFGDQFSPAGTCFAGGGGGGCHGSTANGTLNASSTGGDGGGGDGGLCTIISDGMDGEPHTGGGGGGASTPTGGGGVGGVGGVGGGGGGGTKDAITLSCAHVGVIHEV